MIMNSASMICDKKKGLIFTRFSEDCIKFFYYDNRKMGVKAGLKHKKRQDIYKINRWRYRLPRKIQYINIKKNILVARRLLRSMD